MTAPPRSRPRISPSTQRRGAEAKAQRGLFNRYVRAVQSEQRLRLLTQLAEVAATLERGSALRRVPVFSGGQRVGTGEKLVPLLPSEHAKLLVQRERLVAELAAQIPDTMRAAFREMLPEFAQRQGFTRSILLEVGVPAEDLDAAGLCD